MQIKTIRFFKSALWEKDWPDLPYPEVAFAGRSNVGKSSLLRTILGQRKLIRVSHTPGCTRTINFYLINEKFFFTDLPGYGYAKVANHLRAQWGKSIETYLAKRKQLKGIVLLLDARFGPLANDLQLWEWLNYYKRQTIIVLTKVDKIKNKEREKIIQITYQKFNLKKDFPLYFFSARTAEGKSQLLKAIFKMLIN
ncbi:MAG TPA: YihA family ribosome biogenesis GTP-binding protein [Candidatus Desulfofervidus auxilii]|uniref:Probable GTP-binding protein EngB n=1 Tax=Desulfofervidus auxilii TaxID=1621989 RepID=A0A7C0Y4M5_DESA2|nr:YihA family ribosome biogenesis GTP-binding protein [Candidatus Desulfofervidus auxilii]